MAIPVISNTTSVLGYRKGQYFEYQMQATNTPTSWTANGLPSGMVISSSGLINGAATAAGVYLVKVIATNVDGPSAPLDVASRLPDVFVPSPSANDFHDLYRTGGAGWGLRREYLDLAGRTRKGDESGFHSRMPKEVLSFLDAVKARDMELTGFPDPANLAAAAMSSLEGNIILTTSGMISEAFSEELFKPLARRESTSVFLVGYQDPQSTGGKLRAAEKDGKRFLEIDGEQVEIRAAVENFSGFSGHANAAEIDEWLAVHGKDSQVFLVHGDPGSLRERQQDLSAQGWRRVTIPQHQQSFHL